MLAQQRHGAALKPEAEAGGMRVAAAFHRNAMQAGEMLAVIVEAGDGGRLGRGDRDQHFELQRLLALRLAEQAPGAAEEGVGGDVEAGVEADRGEDVDRPVAPLVAPRGDGLGLSDADQLALVKHLQTGRVARRFVSEDKTRTSVHANAAARQRAALRHRRIDRVASGRSEDEIGLREVRPRVVHRGATTQFGGLLLRTFEAEHRGAEVREAVHVARVFERRLRKHRREAHDLGRVVVGASGDEVGHAVADVDEGSIEPVDSGNAALDEEAGIDEIGQESRTPRGFPRGSRPRP